MMWIMLPSKISWIKELNTSKLCRLNYEEINEQIVSFVSILDLPSSGKRKAPKRTICLGKRNVAITIFYGSTS
jgi:hypothetical protein